MKYLLMILMTCHVLFLVCCTDNQRARRWGGKASLELPKGQKLVTVTWKDSDLWYCTRPMTVSDTPVIYNFHEESSFGLMEGSYTIKESK